MIRKIDLFGSKINLRFNGAQTYQSNIGSLITIFIIGVIIARLISIFLIAIQRNNPTVIFTERQVNDPALFEATSKSFPMAFAMQDPVTKNYYIDESIYTVQAQLQQKFTTFNSSTQQNQTTWKYTDIILQRCTSQNFQNPNNLQYFISSNYTNMYCLPPDAVLPIQGDFPSPVFSQIQFIFKQCQKNCKSQEEINYYLLKSGMALYMSDSYVDPTQFYDPFQIYARNMYWHTSLQMPQDVIIFIRNNYVYSDFGWIISDKDIKKFPSYSFYENFLYPPNFQQYFLTLTFKFEKQKENSYSRKYQDISSIISEIGGFSQSLLAIGFLICTKISQLQLNQQLVNSVFNYDEPEETQQNHLIKEQKTHGCCRAIFKNKQKKNKNNQQTEASQLQQLSSIQNNDTRQIFNKNVDYTFKSDQNQNQLIKFKNKINQSTSSQFKSQEHKRSISNSQNHTLILASILQEQQKIQKDDKSKINQKISNKLIKKIDKINQNSQKLKEKNFNSMLEEQTRSMKLSVWEYIKSIFFPFGNLRQKKKVIEYSINKLYNHLDILQILKRLIEVEKLKRLLLDKDQIKLFDYLPKPTIHLDMIQEQNENQRKSERSEIDLLYQDNRTPLQKVKEAQEAYKNILQKYQQTQLDEKIIQMLDPNLLSVFEQNNTNFKLDSQNERINSKLLDNSKKKQESQINNKNEKNEQLELIKISNVFEDQTKQSQNKKVFYSYQKNNFCSVQDESKENLAILKQTTNSNSLNNICQKNFQNVAEEEINNTIFQNFFNPTKNNQLSKL
ncbi:small GTP-binding domain protein (macronuclear) [Tetrahymena thermophila SB210]|uniref:Small GTP-binding domain protein n=1 Tax=Tetrahymena thermophila (strain SB210) TaxID=312017 RepID=I7LXI3_TETTS|nr:small GTP-binding domain protein [Tetrahymena thermophila SB210]EAS04697.3 small GTP-binding domain protein [Tetrahymena thermophila SB210]|eukprot:XP_001024942.3 small GTP-binding domain protein [Tetrahymena thermophila SB210]